MKPLSFRAFGALIIGVAIGIMLRFPPPPDVKMAKPTCPECPECPSPKVVEVPVEKVKVVWRTRYLYLRTFDR